MLQGRSLLDASEFRRLGRDQAVVFMPGLPPLVVKKRPYFTDPALLRATGEEAWHEPPGNGSDRPAVPQPAGSEASFDGDDPRERGLERDSQGQEMERRDGGL